MFCKKSLIMVTETNTVPKSRQIQTHRTFCNFVAHFVFTWFMDINYESNWVNLKGACLFPVGALIKSFRLDGTLPFTDRIACYLRWLRGRRMKKETRWNGECKIGEKYLQFLTFECPSDTTLFISSRRKWNYPSIIPYSRMCNFIKMPRWNLVMNADIG